MTLADVMPTLALLAGMAGIVALLPLVERTIAARRSKPMLGGHVIEGMRPSRRGNAAMTGGHDGGGGDAGGGSGGDGGGGDCGT